ncbi:MAG: hypothetical protein QM778_04995 [Myxococcales bacterium]
MPNEGDQPAANAPEPSLAQPSLASASPEDPTAREVRELADAERVLAADPSLALRLARTSDAHFAPGFLRQERCYVILRALLALERRSEAEHEARRFRALDQDPAFAARLQRILDDAKRKLTP